MPESRLHVLELTNEADGEGYRGQSVRCRLRCRVLLVGRQNAAAAQRSQFDCRLDIRDWSEIEVKAGLLVVVWC